MEIETLRDFHFIPYEAYPANGDKFQETFIFTGVKYNPADNMLAVSGCYWACPSSVILLDFTNPLKEQDCESWIDIHEIIDADYDIYEDIDFERWGSEDFTLHVTAYNIVTNRKDSLTINLKEESMKSNIE
ncbi:MAG: hypothetical protein K2N34_01155 [Lachnospiraceae bacterium]|nr:hypothetical protein [Lachnospiraceae bacterium]